MHEVAPRQLAAYVVIAILIGIAGARYARSAFAGGGDGGGADAALTSGASTFGAGATTATIDGADAAPPAGVASRSAASSAGGDATAVTIVDVDGAVRHPGVYRLAAGSRIDDAVRRAGGPTAHADLTLVNLAAPVVDGQQIVVPRHGQAAVAAASVAGATGAAGPAGAATPPAPVNLNTATAEQLETLDGVGPATAQKILAYRQQHGSFKSIEELLDVSGIGPKKLAAMRSLLRV